jgi:hypothetical protein
MTRTDLLARHGIRDLSLTIEPVLSEIDGAWRVKITAEGCFAQYVDAEAAAELANDLRRIGERLLATRIEIGIEQTRRCARADDAA